MPTFEWWNGSSVRVYAANVRKTCMFRLSFMNVAWVHLFCRLKETWFDYPVNGDLDESLYYESAQHKCLDLQSLVPRRPGSKSKYLFPSGNLPQGLRTTRLQVLSDFWLSCCQRAIPRLERFWCQGQICWGKNRVCCRSHRGEYEVGKYILSPHTFIARAAVWGMG